MPVMQVNGKEIQLNDEGFMTDHSQWDESVAQEIARSAGISDLTDRHMQVVNFMRQRFLEEGNAPTIRSIGKLSGVAIKELYQLFPKGPAKLAAKIGGIPKPHGCI